MVKFYIILIIVLNTIKHYIIYIKLKGKLNSKIRFYGRTPFPVCINVCNILTLS